MRKQSPPMQKIWQHIETDEQLTTELQKALGIAPNLCRLLVQRNITTYEQAYHFFRPSISDLHDPFLLQDMEKAVLRIEKAIRNRERILLYGDYDVDGTTCVAMLYTFLSGHYDRLDYYIPDRYREGYGISMAGIDYAQQNNISLIIAMDCGIKAIAPVAYAKEQGIDFIICDHHLPGNALPAAVAVLDPKRADCTYPYKELSGCGVVFKLCQAFAVKNDLPDHETLSLLDFVTISIAADIVPITGENRVLAHFGLQQLNQTSRPGLLALIDKSGRKPPLSITDVVFGLAPRINAAGRLADAKTAVKMMITTEKTVAYQLVRELETRNKLRKEIDQKIAAEAKEMFQEMPDCDTRKSIVLFKEDWHKGVIGIAASRVVETFHRPTIIFTESNGKLVGSARSVPGFNVFKAVSACGDLLENYGGHAFAAGMTLLREQLLPFTDTFEAAVQAAISEEQLQPIIKVSAVMRLSDITPTFWKILKQFAPFGPGNRNPVFVSENVYDTGYSKLLKGNHLKLSIRQADSRSWQAIAFGRGDDFSRIRAGQPFRIAYKIEEHNWQGRRYLRLAVKDLQFD